MTENDDITGSIIKGSAVESSINFYFDSENEVLRLCENGDIFVKGKKVINDLEVVDGMRELLKLNGTIK